VDTDADAVSKLKRYEKEYEGRPRESLGQKELGMQEELGTLEKTG
jgi:hypothetical protein